MKEYLAAILVFICVCAMAQNDHSNKDTISLDSLFAAEDSSNFSIVYFKDKIDYKNHKLYTGMAFYIDEKGYCGGHPKYRKSFDKEGILIKEERMDYNRDPK